MTLTCVVVACKSGWARLDNDMSLKEIETMLRRYKSEEAMAGLMEGASSRDTVDFWSIEEELGTSGVLGYLQNPDFFRVERVYYWTGEKWLALYGPDGDTEAHWGDLDESEDSDQQEEKENRDDQKSPLVELFLDILEVLEKWRDTYYKEGS